MAQSAAEKNAVKQKLQLNTASAMPRTNVLTGDRHQSRHLYYQLLDAIRRARGIDIIVSFLMESGVRLLLQELSAALERGARIRILTGNYLGITQPSALYLIRHELGDRVDLRFYNEKDRSFHPKAYIFHYAGKSDVFIGSSNISRSALTSGIEWNYRFDSLMDPDGYAAYYATFEDLFENHSLVIDEEELRRYSKSWHRPAAVRDLEKYDEAEPLPATDEADNIKALYEPRGAQIEALCALENSRAEGAQKGLVMAATGVGKTYLAAFDSVGYSRVLFVAHREEILQQAALSFRNVRRSEDYGFFKGNEKTTDRSVIFAGVQTLGRAEYLKPEVFPPDYFDYIVIDEFHHAVAGQYQRILAYFKPKFLLGLTATPDRMDGRGIYELCDYNVPYEIGLKEAINKGLLVPFRFYGIYDATDYSGLRLVHGTYDEKQLTEIYAGNLRRHDLIYKHYCKYGGRRALGFCCSRAHAVEMAKEFCARGVPAAAVVSGDQQEYYMDRAAAIEALRAGVLRVIFSVDIFNEGVDITDVDMVMFLRPTESPIVFFQQLGRGLRKSSGKEYLTVLDFIGNYEKAGRIRLFLSGVGGGTGGHNPAKKEEFPDNCLIDFDMEVIDLFAELDKKTLRLVDLIRSEYYRVKELLGRRPTRMDLFTYMEDEIYEKTVASSKQNPFRRYLGWLDELGELTPEEKALCGGIGREFLVYLETTSMSKVYKMPVLMAMYNGGKVRTAVTGEELLAAWKQFFDTGTNWKDLDTAGTYAAYKAMTDKKHLQKILTMPVKFLKQSGGGFFVTDVAHPIGLCEALHEVVKQPAFAAHMKDIIEYRTMHYYMSRYANKAEPAAEAVKTAKGSAAPVAAPKAAPVPEIKPEKPKKPKKPVVVSAAETKTVTPQEPDNVIMLPVLGEIAAGHTAYAEDEIEGYEPCSTHIYMGERERYFYLRVRGDSMIGAGIDDGDLVLIRRTSKARNGQIVACLVDGESATLKRYYKHADGVELRPENDAYEPIFVPAVEFEMNNARIIGVKWD